MNNRKVFTTKKKYLNNDFIFLKIINIDKVVKCKKKY